MLERNKKVHFVNNIPLNSLISHLMFCTDDADKQLKVMLQSYYKGAAP